MSKLKKRWLLVFTITILSSLPTVYSYSVTPGKWEVYMYEDNEITPQDELAIKIDNYHNHSISIRLSIFIDDEKTKEGYEPLPEHGFDWIQFSETDITVQGKKTYLIPVTIDIENKTENYNKNWQFYINVEQYSSGTSGATVFHYNYNLLWTIRTPKTYVQQDEGDNLLAIDEGDNLLTIMAIIAVFILITYLAISILKNRRKKPARTKAGATAEKNNVARVVRYHKIKRQEIENAPTKYDNNNDTNLID